MPIEEHQSCTHSRRRKPAKFGKKIGKKSHHKHTNSRNRVASKKKLNYSPEYHIERFSPLYHSDEYKPTIQEQD